MKSIFIFVISVMVNQAIAFSSPHKTAHNFSEEQQLHRQSRLVKRNSSQTLSRNCGGVLQKRGLCLGKPDEDQRRYTVRVKQPIQNTKSAGGIGAFSVPRKPDAQQVHPSSHTRMSKVDRYLNQQQPTVGSAGASNTALAIAQLNKGPPSRIGPPRSSHQSMRQNLLNTGATGISTIAQTELETMSSGQLSLNGQGAHRLRSPTAKVKLRGPGFIEVDNFQGEPRLTSLRPAERGRDALRDPNGAQSIAYTNPGGKSRSRGKGGLVTAKVNKHGVGTANILITQPTGITEEVVDDKTYGTRTFTASSNDPANPATIKVKAAGSIYTSMMVQNKPDS